MEVVMVTRFSMRVIPAVMAVVVLALPGAARATITSATEKPLQIVRFSHAGTACQSTLNSTGGFTYNLPSGLIQTGIAFDGAGNLYVSCWGDNTIDQINLATRTETIYQISGGTGFGALTFQNGVLWACNQHASDVGTISLDPNTDTGTYASVFTATGSACVDALAFDPLDATSSTMWMGTDSGTTQKTTGKTLDEFVSGVLTNRLPIDSTIGHRSGIVATPTSFVLAQPVGGSTSTFQLYQSSDRSLTDFTKFASWSGGRLRPEDLECDATTFPGKTAVWVIFAKKDVARAYQIQGTCT
jgi:streptogramin lyase